MNIDQMIAKLEAKSYEKRIGPIGDPFFEPRIVLTVREAEEIAEELHRLKDLEK